MYDGVKSRLKGQLDSLDSDRRALLAELERLPTEILEKKPNSDTWSILEIVEHMILAERNILCGLPPIDQLSERQPDLRGRMIYPIVMAILRFRIPVKVPSRAMLPRGESSLLELRSSWDTNVSWLRGYIDGLGPEEHRRAVFAHPVTGPIDTIQCLRMARYHFNTHRQQIRCRQISYG